MNRTHRQFLNLLAVAMGTKQNMEDFQDTDWDSIFHLAQLHNITPMIYEAAEYIQSFALVESELHEVWKKITIGTSINQMFRTIEFLQIYDKLNQADIQALVVKGIILRELYPNHYERSSGDEDVYIRRTDFEKVEVIFLHSGLIKEKSKNSGQLPEQVTTYRSSKSGLNIELHVDLFDTEIELFESMNLLFNHAFEEAIRIEIEGITVHTLSPDMHLLFLILHDFKHFISKGFGIRQVCDLVMYINSYAEEINWNWLWEQVTELGYEVFLLNLFDIGAKYLGLDQRSFSYPISFSNADVHSEALLEDILKAGIFGKSIIGQQNSSAVTLQSVIKDKKVQTKMKKDKWIALKELLPGLKYMGKRYTYCRKYPILLPFAWLHRLARFIWIEKYPNIMIRKAQNSIAIGKKRIELFKEYQIIGVNKEVLTMIKKDEEIL